jgi:beta-galactosidase
LFLNGRSLGRKKKGEYEYRLRWDNVIYEPGELKVVAYKNGKEWATDIVKTAEAPARLALQADRSTLRADGTDLSFITVKVVDRNGVVAPRANNRVQFTIDGPGEIAATDNGDPTSFEPFSSLDRNAFNGYALVIVRTKAGQPGRIRLSAKSADIEGGSLTLQSAASIK